MIPVFIERKRGQDIIHGLGQLGHIDFTVLVFIGTAGVIQRGDAVLFIAIQPGGDNTYAYANNNVLGAIDALGLSSTLTELFQEEALPFSPIGPGSDSSTVDTTASLVTHPTTLTDDITDLGVTDLDQLVHDYSTYGSVCDTEEEWEHFSEQLKKIVGDPFDYGNLLVGSQINHVVDNSSFYELYETENASIPLGLISQSANSSILVIPECLPAAEIEGIVEDVLGTLVNSSEIDEIIASLGVDEKGCNRPGIVDVTDLHAEVLARFQTKLETDSRVVDAEKALILAQAALEDFLALNPNYALYDIPGAREYHGLTFGKCNEHAALNGAIEAGARDLADTLDLVYDELVADEKLPPYDVAAAKAEFLERIAVGIVGVFIPLTPEDCNRSWAMGYGLWAMGYGLWAMGCDDTGSGSGNR